LAYNVRESTVGRENSHAKASNIAAGAAGGAIS